MASKPPPSYPICVLMTQAVLNVITQSTIAAYRRRGTEWGGLLWGKVFAHPAGGIVPVVVGATEGACQATAVACDILPASWDIGERVLALQGLTGLQCLGDYHSHPKMGVFLSTHKDVPSFWSCGHIPHWLAMVVDPWRNDYGIFAKDSPQTFHRVPTYLISSRILRTLGLPEPVAALTPSPEQDSLGTGGKPYDQHHPER